MSDTTTSSTAEAVKDGATSTDAPGATPVEQESYDADYVKKLRAEAAKYRTEARANADAAAKLSALEESQKTETQKAADLAAAAQAEAKEARADAFRYRTATKYGLSDEDAETFLTGTDEETIVRQAERLAALHKPGIPRADPSQGARGTSAEGDMNALIRGRIRG